MSAKGYFKNENTKLKELPLKKKIEYIWEYYKLWILGIAFLLVFIISIITTIINNPSEDSILYAAFLNTTLTSKEDTSLDENFIKHLGLEDTDKYLTLDLSMFIDRESNDLYSMNSNQKLVALIAAAEIDVIVSDENNFLSLAQGGGYYNLEEILSTELIEKYSSSFYYTKSEEDGKEHPYGISLHDNSIIKKDGIYPDNMIPILGIPANNTDPKMAVSFLEFLLLE